ncbi:MAG: hypothetical protein Q8N90_00525 [bacterium]|nr:hypothetical protein [bacterium]
MKAINGFPRRQTSFICSKKLRYVAQANYLLKEKNMDGSIAILISILVGIIILFILTKEEKKINKIKKLRYGVKIN